MFESEEDDNPNYWPSISDLFLTLFIISIGVVAVVFVSLLPKNNVDASKSLVVAVGSDLEKVRNPTNSMRGALDLDPINQGSRAAVVIQALNETAVGVVAKIQTLKERQAKIDGLLNTSELDGEIINEIRRILVENEALKKQIHDKPPIIQISEQKEEYRFESGSSEMKTVFVEGLHQNEFTRLCDEIVARQQEGRVKVDTLEIIGHTDGVPISKKGNLDLQLPDLLAGQDVDMSSFTAGSNNDLGLLRALAVRYQWTSFIATRPEYDILKLIKVRCYSAGQTVLPKKLEKPDKDDFRLSNSAARRIEMRLTRLESDI